VVEKVVRESTASVVRNISSGRSRSSQKVRSSQVKFRNAWKQKTTDPGTADGRSLKA
jgi:hypothetical protein